LARLLINLAAAVVLAAVSSCVAHGDTMDTFSAGNCTFTYTEGGVNLKYKDVTVIRRSSLYVVSPGWTKLLFGHHLAPHHITSEDIPGGKLVKVSMGNDVFAATYNVTMLESDDVTIDLAYRLLQDVPAEIEYCLGYFSAPLLADSPFEAESVEGRKSGTVPHAAKSSDQQESMLVPPFNRLRIDSRLASMALAITGDEPNLVIFDARKEPQPWAREAPVFWCGLGVPQRPLQFGRQLHIAARLAFTPRLDVRSAPKIEPASVEITPIKDARLPAEELMRIIPDPKSADFTESDFPINRDTLIVLPDDPDRDDLFAAECLNEELRDVYGLELKVISAREAKSGKGIIAIGEPRRHSVSARLCGEVGLKPPPEEEGYVLKACPQFVLVAGSDTRGTFYGVQTLLQLLKPTVDGAVVRGALINDWPTMKFRGAHVFIGSEAKPFLKKLIRRILARHKLNHLVVEAEYTKWDSHPEIALPWSTSKADLKEIVDCARQHHMEVTPLVQSLGHSEWAFKNNRNLDIAEDPSHPNAFCPSNPGTYKFIFEIYDEAVELFQPKYFHIGHDEITHGGKFPNHEECKKHSITELFMSDVNKLHDYFTKKGIRVMMWGDMMLHSTETPDAGWAESPEGARERRRLLTKDITIADWHYCAADDFPSVRLFGDLGHEVIACTWFTPQNIVDFSRSAKRDGAIGLLQTLWAGFNINESVLAQSFAQFHAYILAAEYAWSSGETALDDLSYEPADVFTRLWRREKADHSSMDGFAVDLSPFANVALSGTPDSWLGCGPEHDPRSFKTGAVRLRGIRFMVPRNSAVLFSGPMNPAGEWPSGLRIPLARKADNLVLLMTAGWHAERGSKVGMVTIRYSNTEAMVLDLIYGENIAAWSDSTAAPSAPIAWMGKTRAGDKVVIRMLNWRNPCPEKTIESVEIISSCTEASPILFAVTGLEGTCP